MKDSEIIDKIQSGDGKARNEVFSYLLIEWRPNAYAIGKDYKLNEIENQDLFHLSLTKFESAIILEKYEGKAVLKGFWSTIHRNLCYDYRYKENRKDSLFKLFKERQNRFLNLNTNAEEKEQINNYLHQCIDALEFNRMMLITLFYFKGMSYQQILDSKRTHYKSIGSLKTTMNSIKPQIGECVNQKQTKLNI